MSERGMAQVVREAGGVHKVGIAAEGGAELAADLGAFQRVGEPGAREVPGVHGDHLRLRGQPAQRRAVQHPGPVPLEGAAAAALGRLFHPALDGGRAVPEIVVTCRASTAPSPAVAGLPSAHRLSLPPSAVSTAARPASSRATGTRNGEQDT